MARGERASLAQVVSTLGAQQGAVAALERDPWKAVVRENVAYLVDDDLRAATYDALREQVGLAPEDILRVSSARLAKVIAGGGMQPAHRAQKLRRAAEVAQEVGLPQLRALMKRDPQGARRVLKRFPGIGDPGADRLLMARGLLRTLAPDSNGLRVLLRLGWGTDDPDYARAYRSATQATEEHLPDDPRWLARAHVLLRQHGKSVCLRNAPACAGCSLRERCPSAATG